MSNWFRANRAQVGLVGLVLGVVILLALMTLPATPVAAAPRVQGEPPSDDTCLACHQQEGMTAQIGGQPLPITINAEKFSSSVHGTEKIACVDCHTNITGFPHPQVIASSQRDFSFNCILPVSNAMLSNMQKPWIVSINVHLQREIKMLRCAQTAIIRIPRLV